MTKAYVAVHHHRFGETVYLFGFLPTEERVIQEIESQTTWEPERDEWIQISDQEDVIINDQRTPPAEGNENSMPNREENAARLQEETERKPKRKETGNALDNEEALEAIQEQLDMVEWHPETLDNIAGIMRLAGFEIRDTN